MTASEGALWKPVETRSPLSSPTRAAERRAPPTGTEEARRFRRCRRSPPLSYVLLAATVGRPSANGAGDAVHLSSCVAAATTKIPWPSLPIRGFVTMGAVVVPPAHRHDSEVSLPGYRQMDDDDEEEGEDVDRRSPAQPYPQREVEVHRRLGEVVEEGCLRGFPRRMGAARRVPPVYGQRNGSTWRTRRTKLLTSIETALRRQRRPAQRFVTAVPEGEGKRSRELGALHCEVGDRRGRLHWETPDASSTTRSPLGRRGDRRGGGVYLRCSPAAVATLLLNRAMTSRGGGVCHDCSPRLHWGLRLRCGPRICLAMRATPNGGDRG